MLSVLRIKDFAIINEIEIEFAEGLNVITGETGAGKSIILRAISLLCGNRASSDFIRKGAKKAIVEGVFHLDVESIARLREINDEMGAIIDDEDLIIRRLVEANGKSKIYINGNLVRASVLGQLACALIDVTGQHQQQSLLNASQHGLMLDSFGVSTKLLAENRERFSQFSRAQKNLRDFQNNQEALQRKFDQISHEFQELKDAELRDGEREELESQIARAGNVEMLGTRISDCLKSLSEDDNSAEEALRAACYLLDECRDIDPAVQPAKELLDSARVQLEEARFSLEQYQAGLEFEPDALENWRARVGEIARLCRKYQCSEIELISLRDKLDKEISELESVGLDEKELISRFEQCKATLAETEEKLTGERKKVAKGLIKKVKSALTALAMKDANFSVEIEASESTSRGKDNVYFVLSANLGEDPKPLAKVASGGELSRVLLVLKTLLNDSTSEVPKTQIFDEIDTGIGGKVARLVGQKLKQVSEFSQVILITHSAQIASLADRHLLVEKHSENKRTSSAIRELDFEQRVQSIATMMGGETGSKKFEASARELLKSDTFS
jgi:DNA repair protein RecN (Recombination protein N)